MLKAILGFLFGKQTDIFNQSGRVEHDLGDQKWDQWDKRLSDNPQYNWKQHKGRGQRKEPKNPPTHH